MKEERKEAIGMMVFCLVWIGVAVLLFLFQAHYRFDDFLDGILGKGTLSSLIKIPLSLLWILIYFGGFFGFFAGVKQFITGNKSAAETKTQQGPGNDAQQCAPAEPDEEVMAGLFAKRDVFFASAQDLEGKLILTTKRLRYIGMSTQKVRLSLEPADIVSLEFSRDRMYITFRDAKGRKQQSNYKLLAKVADSAGFTTLPGAKTYESPTPIPEFQNVVNQWLSKT